MSDKYDIDSFPCSQCGIVFGISREVTDKWRKSGHRFVCPNGHPLSWHPNPQDEEIAELRQKLKRAEEELEASRKELETVRHSLEDMKRELEIWRPSEASV